MKKSAKKMRFAERARNGAQAWVLCVCVCSTQDRWEGGTGAYVMAGLVFTIVYIIIWNCRQTIYIIIILRRRARAHTHTYYIDINGLESAVLLSVCTKYILFCSVYTYTTNKRLCIRGVWCGVHHLRVDITLYEHYIAFARAISLG